MWLTLMTLIATIALGVAITHDHIDAQMVLGSAIALGGVLLVALRTKGAPVAVTQERS